MCRWNHSSPSKLMCRWKKLIFDFYTFLRLSGRQRMVRWCQLWWLRRKSQSPQQRPHLRPRFKTLIRAVPPVVRAPEHRPPARRLTRSLSRGGWPRHEGAPTMGATPVIFPPYPPHRGLGPCLSSYAVAGVISLVTESVCNGRKWGEIASERLLHGQGCAAGTPSRATAMALGKPSARPPKKQRLASCSTPVPASSSRNSR